MENALKHNVASENKPLRIVIHTTDDSSIIVSNNMQRKNILNGSHGMGLSNLKERVNLIIGKEMTIETDNEFFTVKLPIDKIK